MTPKSFGGAALGLLFAATAQAQNRPLTIPYQLTHAVNMDPTFSPDGAEFIYIAVIAGKEQLFRVGLDGKNLRQLTADAADHEDPAWSPDEKKVAFVWMKDGHEQIQVMNTDGSIVEPLTPEEVKTIHPSWAPDSRSLIYCTDDDLKPPKKNDSEIYSIDLATRHVTKLIEGG